MPNGKAGDHPLSDVIIHKMPVYTDEINCLIIDCAYLIRQLIATGARQPPPYWYVEIETAFDSLCTPDVVKVEQNLVVLRKKLQEELDAFLKSG